MSLTLPNYTPLAYSVELRDNAIMTLVSKMDALLDVVDKDAFPSLRTFCHASPFFRCYCITQICILYG